MSNLLEKASIVTTPTAYDNGKILSVKPEEVLGEELVTNGNFATDSDWSKSTGWTISNGIATYDGTGGTSAISQNGIFEINKTYKVTIDVISNQGSGSNTIFLGNSQINTQHLEVGSYTFYGTSTRGTGFNIYGRSGEIFEIDNVSVKEAIDADFDFTRNSSATRVNSQGLIEDVQILSGNLVSNGDFSQEGSEQVTNGNFATDSDWILGTGWSIGDNKAVSDNSGSGSRNLRQNGILTSGKNYKITFEADITSGIVYLIFGGTTAITASGTYTFYKTANGADFQLRNSVSNFIGSIDNVSVKEVGQDWTLGTGWSIGEDKATVDNTVNANLDQFISGFSGKKVKVSFEISDLSSGGILVGDIVNPGAYNATSNGIHTFDYTATNSTFRVRAYGNPCSITNISVVEITDDTNLPRIDYTGGEGHWLFEPQSTNLVVYSQNYNTGWNRQSGNISDGGSGLFYLSPTSNVIKYESTGQGFNQMYYQLPSPVTIGNTYTQQGYVKCDDAPYIHFQISAISSNTFVVWDNINNVVVSAPASVDSYNITSLNGWIKAEITYTAAVASIYSSLKTYFSTSPTNNQTGIPIGIIAYQTFVQVEQQSYATSYIPTNGSTVTRLQDAAFGAGSSDLINSTEGVLYAETKVSVHGGSITLSDGSNNNNLIISFNLSSGRIDCNMKAGGAYQFIFNYTTDMSINNKIAVRYKANDFALFVNGIKVSTDTTGITPAINAFNKINFSSANTASNHLYGKTKCVAVFKEALTDAELECLTTI